MGDKILGQGGISLADQYDVEGSQVLIDELEVREIQGVHEMGATMVSERMSGLIRRSSTGAIAQDIVINDVLNLPATFTRLYGIQVITNTVARVGRASVHLRSSPDGVDQEIPLWVWDGTASVTVDMVDNDTLSAFSLLTPTEESRAALPIMAIGTHQAESAGQIAFRGLTNSFGAGTVIVTLILYMAFAQQQGLSSYGLPLPSW